MLRPAIFIILMLFLSTGAMADPALPEGRYCIYLLTMDPGEELFARFGHIALVVEDRSAGTKKAYNFGTFNFNDPLLRAKYVKGDLEYWLSVVRYKTIVHFYKANNRHVLERRLNLTAAEAEFIAKELKLNARPENRSYAYRHYLDNCCTRIRDLINKATGEALRQGRDTDLRNQTFRDWTRPALKGMPIMRTLILFVLGPAVDRPITRWQEYFLPSVLSADLDDIHLGPERRPLVAKRSTLSTHQGPPVGSKINSTEKIIISVLSMSLLLSFGLPVILATRPSSARLAGLSLIIWGLLAGLGGLVLIIIWVITSHYDGHNNENLFIMPVLHLWLLVPGFKLLFTAKIKDRTACWTKGYLLIAILTLIIYLLLKIGPFVQDNYGFIAFAAVCNISALAALHRSGAGPLK